MPDIPVDRRPRGPEHYDGATYYGRNQLNPAPFENSVVGGYVFLAGLSGAAQIISTLADLVGRRGSGGLVRRGRYLSLAAPLLGAPLLIYDLHTPKRFYNMFRIFRPTSPMSIGTWILTAFSGFAFLTAGLQFLGDRRRTHRWTRPAARATQIPAAVAGAGLATYTASLLSATSTPLWAAAPKALSVRFGASSFASGAAALAIGERNGGNPSLADDLDTFALAALAVEWAGMLASRRTYAEKGISAAVHSQPAAVERIGVDGIGIALPIALKVASGVLGERGGALSKLGSLAILAGSLTLRISVMAAGDESALRPQDSFRFAKPRNVPENR
ncbi:MAG TPA: NrfD/PsrC family molybdoenzyme membrane anchor subunit [Acetobacteraceae bacterium]|jgi:formate-dependent nitrite reductase membrane component NrfD|nr:NrfD/PsrC family molybdoenzyme membrane anchor subunit [Acetobacteraceae bacterium]